MTAVQNEIAKLATAEGHPTKDYACTFLGAVVSEDSAVYAQIGDGAIVVMEGTVRQPRCVFWPQHGEFANSTFFITQEEAEDVLLLTRSGSGDGQTRVQEIAMFSDGLERLILNFGDRSVHAPSLTPILKWLAEQVADDATGPNDALVAYLGSQHVNRRTDDDKTLVLATRLTSPTGAAEGTPDENPR